jgi:hypothetical protein
MALTKRSLYLYNLSVTSGNSSIDFKAVSGGPTLFATLTIGYYSLQDLMIEVARAMNAADPAHTYTTSIDRTFSSGTQNRVTITSSSVFFSLLFLTGPRTATASNVLLGYTYTDKTGATFYQSQSTAGSTLSPSLVGYNYLPPEMFQKVIGSKNISTSGDVEIISFATHRFFQVQFKYEPQAFVIVDWSALLIWMSNGRPLEFTPDISDPSTVINCTLEKTAYDAKGMGFQLKEMLPDFPFLYDTGLMVYRVKPVAVSYG